MFGSDDEDELNSSTQGAKKIETQYSKLALPKRIEVPESVNGVLLRMPNFVAINTKPFEILDQESAQKMTREEEEMFAGVVSLIRYRVKKDSDGNIVYDEKEQPVLESNSRLLQLEDKSFILLVGKESFRVGLHSTFHSYMYSHENSVRNSLLKSTDAPQPAEYNDLEITNGSCLECVHGMEHTMKVEPLSLESNAHKKTTMGVSSKFKKEVRISKRGFASIEENPELDLKLRIQMEEREAREERKKRQAERSGSGYGYNRRMGLGSIGMNASYLEDSQYDDTNVTHLKKGIGGYQRGDSAKDEYSSRSRSATKAKRYDSEGEEEEEDGDGSDLNDFIDDDDEEGEEDEDSESDSDDFDEEDAEEVPSKPNKLNKAHSTPSGGGENDSNSVSVKNQEDSVPTTATEAPSSAAAPVVRNIVIEPHVKKQKRLILDEEEED